MKSLLKKEEERRNEKQEDLTAQLAKAERAAAGEIAPTMEIPDSENETTDDDAKENMSSLRKQMEEMAHQFALSQRQCQELQMRNMNVEGQMEKLQSAALASMAVEEPPNAEDLTKMATPISTPPVLNSPQIHAQGLKSMQPFRKEPTAVRADPYGPPGKSPNQNRKRTGDRRQLAGLDGHSLCACDRDRRVPGNATNLHEWGNTSARFQGSYSQEVLEGFNSVKFIRFSHFVTWGPNGFCRILTSLWQCAEASVLSFAELLSDLLDYLREIVNGFVSGIFTYLHRMKASFDTLPAPLQLATVYVMF